MTGTLFSLPIDVKIRQAHDVLDQALKQVIDERKTVVATVILFSGGDDSTALAHIFASRATHAAHANTGIGIEKTRGPAAVDVRGAGGGGGLFPGACGVRGEAPGVSVTAAPHPSYLPVFSLGSSSRPGRGVCVRRVRCVIRTTPVLGRSLRS